MNITTKRGDQGTTDLLLGGKASKTSAQVEALGAVDELSASLGFARLELPPELGEALATVQEHLITLMGELAMPAGEDESYEEKGFGRISEKEVSFLETMQQDSGALRDWLRPGAQGGEPGARLHLARTTARRAERRTWAVEDAVAKPLVRIYLNRLSDLLWVLADGCGK